uniref:Uncharacterized protein n=1 Tax=Hanusia phi TaxID=3032 RepID=A0A7S0I0V1_9CRYP|mmetsp:Transcript_7692/g.17562  ORF Transcript_7692/g.17562 Transcript_7692/m.17562 type:complete len:204 (+) Transcript_7692:73-684(+)
MSRTTNSNCCTSECGKQFYSTDTCNNAAIEICTQDKQKSCCQLACTCVWKAAGDGGVCVQGLVDRKPMVMYIFVSILSFSLVVSSIYIFRRFVRISKAKKVLAVWQHNQTSPDAPALPEEQIVPFSNLQAVVCHVQENSETELSPPSDCRFCEVQRLAGAPICSRCGNSLFLVAKEIAMFPERSSQQSDSSVDVSTSQRFFPP